MMWKCLTIAGLDPSGGAGLGADLKTFTVLGVYGMSVAAALTAQNTMGVRAVVNVDPLFLRAQIDAVLEDIGADAVKTGMLPTADAVETTAEALERHGAAECLVVDPVAVASSGARLIEATAVQAIARHLLPLAAVVTPNLDEAAALTGLGPIESLEAGKRAAARLIEMGARAVLLTGGHLAGPSSDDLWLDAASGEFVTLCSPRIDTPHTHGTGCVLSAALAAYLARGMAPLEAARRAKYFVTESIRAARAVGQGAGPVNPLWKDAREHG